MCVGGRLLCAGFNCNNYISMMSAMIVGINIVINTNYDGNKYSYMTIAVIVGLWYQYCD